MPWDRTILHVDMDAFFAAVEQLDDPALRGKPILVGGNGPRAVVTTASYEARPFGCRSAMPMATARRLCPEAIVVRGRGARYRELSDLVMTECERITPLVQPVSIDEAYLDVTGDPKWAGDPAALGEHLRARIRAATGGLTASVGVSVNKFLAKLASDLRKPDALVVIPPGKISATIEPLSVTRIPGVGPAAEAKLKRLGVRTIADLRAQDPALLTDRFGKWGARLAQLAMGHDDRRLVTDRDAKSIGHERTFGHDVEDAQELEGVLLVQAEDVARRLRRKHRAAKTVTLKLRYGNFETITRAATLDEASSTTHAIGDAARELFRAWRSREGFRPIRLIGVSASNLTGEVQGSLFPDPEVARSKRADSAADLITEKLGKGVIQRASSIGRQRRSDYDPHKPPRRDEG